MNQEAYRKLISSQARGFGEGLIAFSQWPPQNPHGDYRPAKFSVFQRLAESPYRGAAVISIGNITVGGTGKTPLVIWLCKFLQQKEIQCAVLTRGYKTRTQTRVTSDERQATSDEPAILAESCPQAKIIVNPNRLEAAAEAVSKFGAKVLIMDDGFQHRRLHRDLDIVTIDGTCPFGYGKMLPAGLLREPVASLKRADAVVLTRCDQISQSKLCQIEEELQLINPDMIIAKSIHNPICVKSWPAKKSPSNS